MKVNQPTNRLIWALLAAVIAISLFAFFLVVIMQKITKPIELLKDWAKSLDQNTVQNSTPDFSYNELNVLASLIQSSLVSAHQSLEREQRFLSYASHELRTPIAVVRSNIELLQRLNEKHPSSGKQKQTLERIERASLTMSNLTETLLWLSRNEEIAISPQEIKLDEKISQACSDLEYLLNEKDVEVKIESEAYSVNTIAVSCHIVLNNLIRNAYQHTQCGHIEIKQQGSRITIRNSNTKHDKTTESTTTSESQIAFGQGYGLGLQLSEKIVTHHNWFYEKINGEDSYQVIVDFDCKNAPSIINK